MVPRMPRAPKTALLLLLAPLLTGALPAEPPVGLVWEDPVILTPQGREELELALSQHQRLTGERIFVAISRPETLGSTTDLFDHWHLDTTFRANNALLVLKNLGSGPDDFRPEVSLQLGTGITLPGTQTAEEIEKKEIREAARAGREADAVALRSVAVLLEQLQSPVAARLQEGFWQAPAPPSKSGQRPGRSPKQGAGPAEGALSGLLGWLAAGLVLVVAAGLLTWVYRQIRDQEVLIGPRRWILVGPRLKVRIWFRAKTRKTKPAAGKLVWSEARSNG